MNENEPKLSEAAQNVVENLAFRIAARQGGVIRVNDLLPYLPMSLGMIETSLEDMVDETTVQKEEVDGQRVYRVAGKHLEKGAPTSTCLGCDTDLRNNDLPLCPQCEEVVQKELDRLAERTGWPAQAVYEHEILYLASQHPSPHFAPELAGHSRYTLRKMREKLKILTVGGAIRQEIDEANATIAYYFPPITYPKAMFQRNMEKIRKHPASVMEEIELKVTRILLTLALMLVGVFILGFLRIPFLVLIGGFCLSAPIVAIWIWRQRTSVGDFQT